MERARLSDRLATVADAAAIAAIYSEGIEDRIATFETEPRTVEQIAAHLSGEYGQPGAARARRVSRGRRLSAAWDA